MNLLFVTILLVFKLVVEVCVYIYNIYETRLNKTHASLAIFLILYIYM